MHGRRQPYTEIGLRRLPCSRCGEPSRSQWQICSDGNTWRPICDKCDVLLNKMVLRFFGFTDWKEKMSAYRLNKDSD